MVPAAGLAAKLIIAKPAPMVQKTKAGRMRRRRNRIRKEKFLHWNREVDVALIRGRSFDQRPKFLSLKCMRKALFPFPVCVLAVSGCSKCRTSGPSANQSQAATPGPGNRVALDACTLLTSAEIEALQGEPLQESKSTAPGDKSLTVSQCFFQLPTLTKSISLQVVRSGNAPGARTAQQMWGEMFAPAKLQEFEKEGGAEKYHRDAFPVWASRLSGPVDRRAVSMFCRATLTSA